jgi:hypothetical protein
LLPPRRRWWLIVHDCRARALRQTDESWCVSYCDFFEETPR